MVKGKLPCNAHVVQAVLRAKYRRRMAARTRRAPIVRKRHFSGCKASYAPAGFPSAAPSRTIVIYITRANEDGFSAAFGLSLGLGRSGLVGPPPFRSESTLLLSTTDS